MLVNIGAVFVTRALSPMIRMGLLILLSRMLGTKGLGEYQIILTYFAIFEAIPTLGLRRLVTRESAKDAAAALSYLLHGGLLGLVVSVGLIGVMRVASAGYSDVVRQGMLLLSFALFPSMLLVFCEALLVAFRRVTYMVLAMLVENALLVLGGCWLLWQGFGLVAVVAVMLGLRVLTAGVGLGLALPLCPVIKWRLDRLFLRRLLAQAPIFLGTVLASNLFWRLDVIMLSRLRTPEEVGLYAAALRITVLCQEVPKSILLNLLPPLASLYPESMVAFRVLIERTAKYLLIYVFPVALGALVLAPDIVAMIFGPAFSSSASVLSVLAVSLLPFGLMKLFGNVLVAAHYQWVDFATICVGVGLNFGLNTIFIPMYGVIGAAYTTLLTVTTAVVLRGAFLWMRVSPMRLDRRMLSAVVATLGLWAVLTVSRGYPTLVVILASIPIYLSPILNVLNMMLVGQCSMTYFDVGPTPLRVRLNSLPEGSLPPITTRCLTLRFTRLTPLWELCESPEDLSRLSRLMRKPTTTIVTLRLGREAKIWRYKVVVSGTFR